MKNECKVDYVITKMIDDILFVTIFTLNTDTYQNVNLMINRNKIMQITAQSARNLAYIIILC